MDEEDHLIPLGLGGAPRSLQSLWPEPRQDAGGWTADVKEKLEWRLNQMVCNGQMKLATAQSLIASNWEAAPQRLSSAGFMRN